MDRHTLKDLERMSVMDRRQLLKALNKEARKRAGALIKAGYDGNMTEPPIKDYQRTKSVDLVRAVADLEIYVNNPLSTVKGMEQFVSSTLETLHSHRDSKGQQIYGFVNEGNLADFGRFMNYVRDTHGEKGFPSDQVSKMYKNFRSLGVSAKTIERKFSEYLTSEAGIMDLSLTLESMQLPEHRKRISSTEIFNQMGELGLL